MNISKLTISSISLFSIWHFSLHCSFKEKKYWEWNPRIRRRNDKEFNKSLIYFPFFSFHAFIVTASFLLLNLFASSILMRFCFWTMTIVKLIKNQNCNVRRFLRINEFLRLRMWEWNILHWKCWIPRKLCSLVDFNLLKVLKINEWGAIFGI